MCPTATVRKCQTVPNLNRSSQLHIVKCLWIILHRIALCRRRLREPASDKKSGGVTSLCNAPTSFLRATRAPTALRGKLVGKRASGYYVVDVDALAINRSTPKPVAAELSACRSGIRNSSSSSVRMISLYLRNVDHMGVGP